jgi:hypothetical protein
VHLILLHSLQVTQPTYYLPLYPFYYISYLLNYSSFRFVLLFHSPSSYLGPYFLLKILFYAQCTFFSLNLACFEIINTGMIELESLRYVNIS